MSGDREREAGVPGADKLGGDGPGAGSGGRSGVGPGDEAGSDLGPGAPPEHPPLPEPDEPFQSPMSVAGIGPGGEPYRGRSPSEENPAADPNEGP